MTMKVVVVSKRNSVSLLFVCLDKTMHDRVLYVAGCFLGYLEERRNSSVTKIKQIIKTISLFFSLFVAFNFYMEKEKRNKQTKITHGHSRDKKSALVKKSKSTLKSTFSFNTSS